MRILVVTIGLFALVTSGYAQLPIDTRDLRLQIATGETITLNAPAGTAGYSLTLPTTRGSSGSLLSSDGAGGLLWVAPNTTFWQLTGNTLLDSTTAFLGSPDEAVGRPLIMRTDGTERLRIAGGSGFVGIGTSSPGMVLDVAGTFRASGMATMLSGMLVTGSTTINSTGTAATTLGNTGSSVTIGSVGGTVKTSVGANDRVVLANSSGLLDQASISSVVAAGIAGNAWTLTGNAGTTESAALGAAATNNFLGTTDAKSLSLVTNNIVRAQISSAGVLSTQSDMQVNGVRVGMGLGSVATNTVVGATALNANTTGYENTALGSEALRRNTTGYKNTAIGYDALSSNTTGYQNTAVGVDALVANTTGFDNSALGWLALGLNTTGQENTAVGKMALYQNSSGNNNTAIGSSALTTNSTGANNTVVGTSAMFSSTTSGNNTAIGESALFYNTTGGNNTALGYRAGRGTPALQNSTGSNSVFLGAEALPLADAQTNQIVIGYQATGLGSNSVILGNSSIAATRLQGRVGIGMDPTGASNVTGLFVRAGSSQSTNNVFEAQNNGGTALVSIGSTGLITGTGGATITGATLINSTGTAATTLGNTGSSVTIGSVGGTVKTSVGANDRVVLANSSGLLDQASISSVVAAGIAGNAWALTGNSGTTNGGTLGSAPTGNFIGTTGTTGAGTARDLSLVTNNVIQAQLSTAGVLSTQNDMVVNSVRVGRGAGSLASNTAVGASALNANTTGGTGNSAFGENALKANTTGDNNSALGRNALQASTTGSDNTASGASALYSNTTGFQNTAIGSEALYTNTSGYGNTASGSDALHSNTTGANNTASGWRALNMNTEGTNNTASGADALQSNTTGSFNTASGYGALNNNTTGASNTASGYLALNSNTTGANNNASGAHALKANTTGSFNTASGMSALTSNTTASANTANGYYALYSNTTGQSNTAVGVNALAGNTTGSFNTALGLSAGEFITDGTTSNATGSNSLFLGSDTRANADAQTNQIVIGYQATGLGSNSVILGNNSVTATRLQGRVGIGMDPTGASNVTGLFVRAGSSQSTNNVFEAQNNGGTALVSIGSTGLITGTGGATITGATLINSTGTAATTLGNTGSSVTIGSVGGTVKTSVGANDRVVLANSSGLLDQASISSVVAAGIAGNAWTLTGNSGTDSTANYIGTTDEAVGRPLVIRTDGIERMRVAGGSGNVGVGTAAPNVRMDVDGGLATRPTAVSATGSNTAITVGNRSFVVVTSDEVFSSRKLTLSDGLQDGQRLVILVLGSGGNSTFGARLETSDSNLRLSGDAGLEHNDTIELVWYSTNWFELKRSANDD